MEFAFDLDPCPLKADFDGLQLDWNGRRVFCNPPYSEIRPWVEKAVASRALTVFVVPARHDSKWSSLLRECGAEFRYFCRGFDFTHASGKPSHPLGGAMVAIVRPRMA